MACYTLLVQHDTNLQSPQQSTEQGCVLHCTQSQASAETLKAVDTLKLR